MKDKKLFLVVSTLSVHSTFYVDAVTIDKAITKADKIVKEINPDAEVTKVEVVKTKLLEE